MVGICTEQSTYHFIVRYTIPFQYNPITSWNETFPYRSVPCCHISPLCGQSVVKIPLWIKLKSGIPTSPDSKRLCNKGIFWDCQAKQVHIVIIFILFFYLFTRCFTELFKTSWHRKTNKKKWTQSSQPLKCQRRIKGWICFMSLLILDKKTLSNLIFSDKIWP